MPSVWDHKADKDLLFSIIEDGNLTGIDWQSVASKMKAKDYNFSQEACRQHYQKMRREAKNGGSGGGDAGTTNATPTKPKAMPSKGTPSKRKSKPTADNEEEDGLAATPVKRKKGVKKDKTENSEEQGNGFVGQTAMQFKVEDPTGGADVDVSDEGLYA